jgi:hypothetical protein
MNPLPSTVADAFAQAAEHFGDRPFLCVLPETAGLYDVPAGQTTYAKAQMQVERLRVLYRAAGYGHGHRVGLLLENRPAFFLHWFALNGLGVSVVPINPDLRSAELEYLIGHSEIALAVALPERHDALRAAARAAGREMPVIGADAAPPTAPFAAPLAGAAIGGRSECALLYTSGTTGRPKGCMLPNRYFVHAGEWYAGIGGAAQLRPRRGTHAHAAAAGAHERDGVLDDGDGDDRRLPDPARPLPSEQLVGQRARIAGHGRALPGRDAGDADEGRRGAAGSAAPRALRLRRRGRPQPACTVRGALRFPAARGLGHDRDRRRRRGDRAPRAAARRHELLRPRRRGCRGDDRGRQRRTRPASTSPASCWCAMPAPIRATASSPAT